MDWWDYRPVSTVLVALAALIIATPLIVLFYWAFHSWQSRQVRRFAAAQGFSFLRRNDALLARWPFPPFSQGARRRVRNVAYGAYEGYNCASMQFERRYTDPTASRNRTSIQYIHVVSVQLPQSLPDTSLARHDSADAYFHPAAAPGAQPHSGWRLQTTGGTELFSLLNNAALAAWCRRPEVQRWSVRIHGTDALIIASGYQQIGRTMAMVDALVALIATIPAEAWQHQCAGG